MTTRDSSGRWALSLILSISIGGIACINPLSAEAADLEDAKAKWKTNGYSNYQMQYRETCLCPLSLLKVTIDVESGSVVAIREVAEPRGLDVDSLLLARDISFSSFNSVEDLFGVIERAIDDRVADLSVTYHSNLGYPIIIEIDRIKMAIDDEIGYEVTGVIENEPHR